METIDWENIDEVIKVLEKMKREEWTWMKNSRCKYLNLRVDMRDGHCVIKDRNGLPINIEELNFQFELN